MRFSLSIAYASMPVLPQHCFENQSTGQTAHATMNIDNTALYKQHYSTT